MNEEWRTVEVAPSYELSNFGRIRRKDADARYEAGRLLKPCSNQRGYQFVCLITPNGRKNGYLAPLVCHAFHGPRPSSSHVCAHNDGDPKNNRSDNLRWATQLENVHDKWRHGTMQAGDSHWTRTKPHLILCGSRHPQAHLSESDVNCIRASERRQVDLAELFRVSQTTISDIKRGRTWRHLLEEAA
jgi:hypothetical protein